MLNNKQENFKNLESLQPVVNVVNEATIAVNDRSRTIIKSSIPSVLAGALGAGVGSTASFAALYGLGTVGLSAAGITSGLAAAGSLIGRGMAAGIFVLSMPITISSIVGVSVARAKQQKKLKQEKDRLLKVAIERYNAIVMSLRREIFATRERVDYLTSLNILLRKAIIDLKADLQIRS